MPGAADVGSTSGLEAVHFTRADAAVVMSRPYWKAVGASAAATCAASAVWTAAVVLLTISERLDVIGLLLAAELAGSLLSRPAARLTARHRFRFAAIMYAGVRAALIPLVAVAAPVWTLTVVSLLAGGAWRVLAAQFTVAAVTHAAPDQRTRALSVAGATVGAGAVTGTAIAGVTYQVNPVWWALTATVITVALTLTPDKTAPTGPDNTQGTASTGGGTTRLPHRLWVASTVGTFAATSLNRLAAVIITMTAGAAWVGVGAGLALAAGWVVPVFAPRFDRRSLPVLAAVAGLAPLAWTAGALVPLAALAAWPAAAFVAQLVDTQFDDRAAAGPDPAALVARLQTSQAVAGAAGGLVAAPALAAFGLAAVALPLAGIAGVTALVLKHPPGQRRAADTEPGHAPRNQ